MVILSLFLNFAIVSCGYFGQNMVRGLCLYSSRHCCYESCSVWQVSLESWNYLICKLMRYITEKCNLILISDNSEVARAKGKYYEWLRSPYVQGLYFIHCGISAWYLAHILSEWVKIAALKFNWLCPFTQSYWSFSSLVSAFQISAPSLLSYFPWVLFSGLHPILGRLSRTS